MKKYENIAIVCAMKMEMDFYKSKGLNNVFQSGIGLVNAATTTQNIIDTLHPDLILMTGIAGGLRNLKQGDIVVADKLDYSFASRNLIAEDKPNLETFPVQNELVEFALNSIKGSKKGGITSSNYFIGPLFFETLLEQTDAIACEMEGASLAHTCLKNDTDFLVIRTISDMCDKEQIFDSEENFQNIKRIVDNLNNQVYENLLPGLM